MNIGAYTFSQFHGIAEEFHGCAAPGLLIGGYMVELAKGMLPEGTLFEAVAETSKCLPDAVQLLSLCSTGNKRLHVRDLGLYAVSLYDKKTGLGVRVSIDPAKLYAYPEIQSWFMKEKPKHAQDIVELERQIEEAGHSICKVQRVQVEGFSGAWSYGHHRHLPPLRRGLSAGSWLAVPWLPGAGPLHNA